MTVTLFMITSLANSVKKLNPEVLWTIDIGVFHSYHFLCIQQVCLPHPNTMPHAWCLVWLKIARCFRRKPNQISNIIVLTSLLSILEMVCIYIKT